MPTKKQSVIFITVLSCVDQQKLSVFAESKIGSRDFNFQIPLAFR